MLSEAFISTVYAVLLGFLGTYAMIDFIKSTRKSAAGGGGGGHDAHGGPSGMTPLSISIQKINIPPMITFDEDFGGRRISWLFVAMGGVIVGALAAIMGVGGGFVTFPMFVYIFGVSTATTVGTDILQIIFTAGLASIVQYAIYGYVFYTLAVGMLIGSLIGIQVGALTTKVVKGIHIRGFYAMSIIAGFINRASTLPKKLTELEYINMDKAAYHQHRVCGEHHLLDCRRVLRLLGHQQVLCKHWKIKRGGIEMAGSSKKHLGYGIVMALSFWVLLFLIFSPIFPKTPEGQPQNGLAVG